MRRGEIWTVAGGTGYAGKPRPAVVIQDESFDVTASVTICIFTTAEADAPLIRLPIEPTDKNGLRLVSWLMVDKIVTVRRVKVGRRLGHLDDEDVLRLNRAILVFLGLAASRRSQSAPR